MSTLGKTWRRNTCNRGHELRGAKECAYCKSLRNKKYRMRKAGERIASLIELDKTYFNEYHGRGKHGR